MTFKEQIEADISNVFINFEEFAEEHMINSKKMLVIIDDLEQVDRQKRYKLKHSLYADGVYLREKMIYVRASDFGSLPSVGRSLNFDGKTYIVTSSIDEDGIYSIELEMNKT